MSEQVEQVYWVRLTAAEREDALDRMQIGMFPTFVLRRIESARPEHPKRREALEELGRRALMLSGDPDSQTDFHLAVDRLRALEGK